MGTRIEKIVRAETVPKVVVTPGLTICGTPIPNHFLIDQNIDEAQIPLEVLCLGF
jgi:hypothetical protein